MRARLVVCGAPGSAGAPLAQALVEAGLFLGDQAQPGRGGWEDVDFAAFQRGVVEAGGDVAAGRWQAEARALLERKLGGRPVAGWKEGRTAFLLPLWEAVLPDACWVFVYRDPAVSAWSLLKRDVFATHSALPWRRVLRALRAWRAANARIVELARRHPERTLVLRAHDDFDAAGEAALRRAVVDWGLPLAPPDLVEAFRPHLVKRRTPRWIAALARVAPGVRATWRALEYLRAGGPRRGAPAPPPRPTVCVFASSVRREYSQTFVHDHLRRLPARTTLLVLEDRTLCTQDSLPLLTAPERLAAAVLREFGYATDGLRDRALARYLRREGVSAMLIEFADHAAALVEGCRRAGVPFVVHFHGFDAYLAELLRQKQDDYRVVFAAAGAIVAVSHAMEEQLLRLGAPPEKIRYCPCGVDAARFAGGSPASAPPTFAAVGRFVEKKGPQLTLLAFRAVRAACPDARLVMAGDGPLLGTCRTLARQFALEDAVEFRGVLTHAEVLGVLRRARAFVQHSMVAGGDSEGTPVAVLEAAACGVPVVSTRHAGIPDVVRHGEDGYLVAEGDVAAMAAHMLALARDPVLAATLGRNARARILAEFASERAIERLWHAIEGVSGRANAGR